jgi:hypothetical protein
MHATSSAAIAPYPVRVEGHLELPARWSWLLKWLALPHVIVLAVPEVGRHRPSSVPVGREQ